MTQDRTRIDSLQALRGLAALLVAGLHLHGNAVYATGGSGPFVLFRNGAAGVDLFFVLSGFIICTTASRDPGLTPGRFLAGRFWRIVPPYWLVLGLAVGLALAWAAATGDPSKVPSLRTLIVSALLLPFPDYVIIITWTLSLEMVFYLLFAVTWLRHGRTAFFAAMLVWVAVSQLVEYSPAYHSPLFDVALHSSALEFLYGALIAEAMRRGPLPLAAPALATGVALLAAHLLGAFDAVTAVVGREIIPGIPAALLVYGALGWRRGVAGWAVLLGEASYILYLIHLLSFSLLRRPMSRLLGGEVYASPLGMALMLAATIALAILACVLLERPYHAWYRHRLATRRHRVHATA